MTKSEKTTLKGQQLTSRLTGIPTPVAGMNWEPPIDERDKARRLCLFLADQRALHYPYDKEIGSFVVQSVLDAVARITRDMEDLSVDSVLRHILGGMQATCRKFLDENQSPSAGYGWPYEAQLYCTLGELRALLGIHIARIACAYDLEVDACLVDILPPEADGYPSPDRSHNTNLRDPDGS